MPPIELAGTASRWIASRVGMPEDIARLIYFLMSSAGETFTGGIFGAQPIVAR